MKAIKTIRLVIYKKNLMKTTINIIINYAVAFYQWMKDQISYIFITLRADQACLRLTARPSGQVALAGSVSGWPKVWFVKYICLPAPSPLLLPGVFISFFYWYFLMGGDPLILILQPGSWPGQLIFNMVRLMMKAKLSKL